MKHIDNSELAFYSLIYPALQLLTDENLRYCLNRMFYCSDEYASVADGLRQHDIEFDTYQYWTDRVDAYFNQLRLNRVSRDLHIDQHSYTLEQYYTSHGRPDVRLLILLARIRSK